MKTKILYIVSSLRKAGPIIVLQNLIRHLDKEKYEAEIVKLSTDEPQRSITHEFIQDGIKVHELNYPLWFIELFPAIVARKIKSILPEIAPTLIHTQGYQAAVVSSRLKTNIPLIETLHCISGESFPLTYGNLMGKYMNRRYLHTLKKFNHTAAISETVRNYYDGRINQVPIDVISNGVADIPSDMKTRQQLRKEFGVEDKTFIFVSVGSLIPLKDPIAIIDAFKKAFPDISDQSVQLWFVGKGSLYKACEERKGDDDRIKLCGWSPEPYKYLRLADWSVTASHTEGFGLNFIESLIVGTPIISTRLEAFKSFDSKFHDLSHFKFDPGDTETLAELMKKAITTKIDRTELHTMAETNYSSQAMADKYETIYNHLVRKSHIISIL